MSNEHRFEALEGTLARVQTLADAAIAEYRADRGHDDGGWGEHLAEVLEQILTTARR